MSDQTTTPLLWEKFVVTACSPDCKCVVTATSTLGCQVRSILINKCCREHDAVMAGLDEAARQEVLAMVARYLSYQPIGHAAVFTADSTPKTSEGSNVQLPLARSTK